ncbi:hypothetical protein [Succinivibrio sp.]|uniref:hypothetical protein n=1 Tax=Succinivibrio sp. TaxID=2053619 RepID=UPI00386B6294
MAASTNSPLSFRASDDVKQRFQAIIESEPELKANDVFERLLNAYETSKHESNLPEFASEFKDFAAHLNSLNTKFHNACQMVTNAEEKAAQQFKRDLEEKSASIESLTDQVNALKQEKSNLLELKETLLKESTEARLAKDSADATVIALNADKDDLRKQIEGLNSQIESLKQREQDLNKINADQNLKLKESEVFADKINELNNSVTNLNHKNDLQTLEIKNKEEQISEYKQSLQDKENSIKSMNGILASLKEENASLKAQFELHSHTIEDLKNQLEAERNRNEEIQQKILDLMTNSSAAGGRNNQ